MDKGHVKASIFIDEKGNQTRFPGLKVNGFRVIMVYAMYLCLLIVCIMLDAIISSL